MSEDKNSLHEPAWKLYESPHAGEPVAEDGYIPRNRYAKPAWFGVYPDFTDTNYKILNDPVLVKKKAELRNTLKQEYLRQIYNPYRHAAATGGQVFDSNTHRYITLLRTHWQYIRPSPKVTIIGICVYFVPTIITYWYVMKTKAKDEAVYRSGAIAYKDRDYKFAC